MCQRIARSPVRICARISLPLGRVSLSLSLSRSLCELCGCSPSDRPHSLTGSPITGTHSSPVRPVGPVGCKRELYSRSSNQFFNQTDSQPAIQIDGGLVWPSEQLSGRNSSRWSLGPLVAWAPVLGLGRPRAQTGWCLAGCCSLALAGLKWINKLIHHQCSNRLGPQ